MLNDHDSFLCVCIHPTTIFGAVLVKITLKMRFFSIHRQKENTYVICVLVIVRCVLSLTCDLDNGGDINNGQSLPNADTGLTGGSGSQLPIAGTGISQ